MKGRQIICPSGGAYVSRTGAVLNGYYKIFISHKSRVIVLKVITTEEKFECRHQTHSQFEETLRIYNWRHLIALCTQFITRSFQRHEYQYYY